MSKSFHAVPRRGDDWDFRVNLELTSTCGLGTGVPAANAALWTVRHSYFRALRHVSTRSACDGRWVSFSPVDHSFVRPDGVREYAARLRPKVQIHGAGAADGCAGAELAV